MNIEGIRIGADPEVIIATQMGMPKSIIGMIGGTKEEPLPVLKGALQEDNMLAEFNIDPASSPSDFSENITTVMNILRQRVPEYILSPLASVEYSLHDIMEGGEKAISFGCDPDMNAWALGQNEPPDGNSTNLRTAGGHIHVGLAHLDKSQVFHSVRMMDYFLGIPSVLLDNDKRRRELYGKAGSFRFKPYGFEYRTLSNFWIFSEELREWAFNNTCKAMSNLEEIDNYLGLFDEKVVQTTINEGDKEKAHMIINALAIPMP